MHQIVTHLIAVQLERGNMGLFLHTKLSTARFFSDLGFCEIARVGNTLVFMENRRNGFFERRGFSLSVEFAKSSNKNVFRGKRSEICRLLTKNRRNAILNMLIFSQHARKKLLRACHAAG